MVNERRNLILVVDDTEANRYVLVHLLKKAGYDVEEADSIAVAETKLVHQPDLVVCDVNLPDGKGTAFTQRLKARSATESTMVLNMSASYTRTRDRIEGLDRGADGYLIQPIDPSDFLATVASLLRLRRAEEKVRRKNEELELVSHAISHDLQEPLRMISSYLDLVCRPGRSQLDETQARYLGIARQASARMHRIIADLTSLTVAGHGSLKLTEFPLRAAVDEALDSLSVQVDQHHPAIDIGPLPTVTGDRGLITQVFQNLLSNTMKYRSERPLTVSIDAERRDQAEFITVRDNGMGIPPASVESIFRAFKRLHSHAEIPGSGIGLALCKKIVELHGGTIGCTSEQGVGSAFWFSLGPAVAAS